MLGSPRRRVAAFCLATLPGLVWAQPPAQDAQAMSIPSLEAGAPTLANQRYVQAINRAYLRSGTLWEGRFRSCLVDSEAYVLACYRYIELNPVRASMVRDPWDYPWSSHRMNVSTQPSGLMTPHATFLSLAADAKSRAAAYRDFVVQGMPDDVIADIRRATAGSYALGSAGFQERVGAMLGRRVVPGIPGRPRRGG